MEPEALLAALRKTLGRPSLELPEPPQAIAGGYDTAIFAFRLAGAPDGFSESLILRLFRVETPGTLARFEAAVQTCVAGLGLPAPRVFLVNEDPSLLGGAFMVMERLPGEPLVRAIFSPAAPRVPGWLAALQARLHAHDAAALERALAAAGFDPAARSAEALVRDCARTVESLGLDGLRAAADWLGQKLPEPSAPSICHGDFHPLNVLWDRARVTGLIDWSRVHVAPTEYDVGSSIALMSHGPIRVPAWLRPVARRARALLVRRYVAAYRALRPLDPARLRYFEALRLMEFLVDEGGEQAAELAGRGRSSKPSPWTDPAVQRGILVRFESLTGIRATLPRARA